jgi:hypothetical protein
VSRRQAQAAWKNGTIDRTELKAPESRPVVVNHAVHHNAAEVMHNA